jgi:CRISPR-associated endonuclease Cas2
MYKLVYYDIESDTIRTKVAKRLERYGLVRLQKSVFVGFGNNTYWCKVLEQLKKWDEKLEPTDSICMLAIGEKDLLQSVLIGNKELLDPIKQLQQVIIYIGN